MLIAKITDKDLGLAVKPLNNPAVREASRGILVKNGKVAVFHKAAKNEYKLPGGGLDAGEQPIDGFKREIMEETGCTVKNVQYIGTTEEHKSQTNFLQISHIFVAEVDKDTKTLHLTEKEKIEKSELLWVDINEAIQLVEDSYTKLKAGVDESVYMTKFIIKRDSQFLRHFKSISNNFPRESE